MLIAKNPILTGFHPDPCILRVEDDYFLATSTFQWFPGVQLYHSKDLVNWQEIKSPLNRKSQLDMQGNPNSGGVWAPCLSYCDGTYYLIYTNTRNFHGIFKDTHNYLVTTKDIFSGEWSEPIYLNSSGFDPSLFHDEDGKKYLVNMRWDHRAEYHDFNGILMQEYSEKEKKLVGPVVNIFKGTKIGATEAPHIYKKDGYYYLMVAEGGTMYNHGVQMARSKNIWGPYEADPRPLLTTRNNPEKPYQRTGHASLVCTQNNEWYVAYLCGRPVTSKGVCILGRETCIAKVKWDSDGWLRLENDGEVPPTEYESSLKECPVPPILQKEILDFETLPPHFNTLRLPLDEIGSLTERKGYLRLYGNEAITSWNKQSMVARRLQHHRAEAICEMEFNPQTFQQMAGLTVFYDTYNFFYLYLSSDEMGSNELRIIVRDGLKFREEAPSGVKVGKTTKIFLRAVISYGTLEFSYSLNGVDYTSIGGKLDCTNLSDEAYGQIGHEGHTGTFIGMACQDLTGNHTHADFRSFSYKELK